MGPRLGEPNPNHSWSTSIRQRREGAPFPVVSRAARRDGVSHLKRARWRTGGRGKVRGPGRGTPHNDRGAVPPLAGWLRSRSRARDQLRVPTRLLRRPRATPRSVENQLTWEPDTVCPVCPGPQPASAVKPQEPVAAVAGGRSLPKLKPLCEWQGQVVQTLAWRHRQPKTGRRTV